MKPTLNCIDHINHICPSMNWYHFKTFTIQLVPVLDLLDTTAWNTYLLRLNTSMHSSLFFTLHLQLLLVPSLVLLSTSTTVKSLLELTSLSTKAILLELTIPPILWHLLLVLLLLILPLLILLLLVPLLLLMYLAWPFYPPAPQSNPCWRWPARPQRPDYFYYLLLLFILMLQRSLTTATSTTATNTWLGSLIHQHQSQLLACIDQLIHKGHAIYTTATAAHNNC